VVKKRPIPYHPLLAAVLPVLLLLSANVGEVTLVAGRRPLLVSLAVAAAIWLLLALVLRSVSRGAALTTFLIALTVGAGMAMPGLASLDRGGTFLHVVLSLALVVGVGVGGYLVL